MERIPSHKMVRELPPGAKVVSTINGIDLYNINTFQNIMSWNQHNLEVPAFEYFGTQISYGDLPKTVEEYAKGFDSLGIKKDTVVTMSLPVSNEYYLSLFAALNLGAISNNVNFLFLRNDMATYTLDKNSDTLMILDIYLPIVAEQLQESRIKNVILTSLNDYLPEDKKTLFADLSKMPKKIREYLENPVKMAKAMGEMAKLRHINFINMSEIIKVGRETRNVLCYPEFDIKKDSIYSYTSGTTGAPKCIVFNEQSPNAIIEMHNGVDLKDFVGDRSLVVIPASHATGMFYAAYLQLAKGKTLVLQPIYDKKTFATDIRDFHINHTLAAASFYMEAAAQDNIEPGEYKDFNRPCTGGEPLSKAYVFTSNTWLHKCGSPAKLAIGGGAGEMGSSSLTSYDLDPVNKTNETGYPLKGVYVKIVDPKTGEVVKRGERGILHISSAAAADRYLNNPEATDAYFYVDEDSIRWGNLGDIAVQNPNGSYSMLGRAMDSYVKPDGEIVYLFDIEDSLSPDDPIIEWEISAFKTGDNNTDVVAQVVLKSEYVGKESELVELICNKYHVDGVKFYDGFETSEVTGKRDYQLLKHDYEGYYRPLCSGKLLCRSYSPSGKITEFVVDSESINSHIKKLIK